MKGQGRLGLMGKVAFALNIHTARHSWSVRSVDWELIHVIPQVAGN